jgi:hypothetical protein
MCLCIQLSTVLKRGDARTHAMQITPDVLGVFPERPLEWGHRGVPAPEGYLT